MLVYHADSDCLDILFKLCETLLYSISRHRTSSYIDGFGRWKLTMHFVGHCQDMLCSWTMYLLACPFYICHCCILFWFQFGSEVHHYYDLSGYSHNLYFVLIFPWFTRIFQRLNIPSCNCIVLTNRFCLRKSDNLHTNSAVICSLLLLHWGANKSLPVSYND